MLQRMAKTVSYQNYRIKSEPVQLTSTGQWMPHVTISWEEAGAVTLKQFSPATTYESEEEADVQSVTFCQQVIDGKIPGQTVK